MEWISALAGHPVKFPKIDLGTMMPRLCGMLGLGAYRTGEKVKVEGEVGRSGTQIAARHAWVRVKTAGEDASTVHVRERLDGRLSMTAAILGRLNPRPLFREKTM